MSGIEGRGQSADDLPLLRERVLRDADEALPTVLDWTEQHEHWPVRAACLKLLSEHYIGDPRAVSAIKRATHDPVDWVAFTAIQLAEQHRLLPVVQDLIRITGWPSNFTNPNAQGKPVGCGAAFTKRALRNILGSSDHRELRNIEDAVFAGHRRLLDSMWRPRINDDVVRVPAGPFRMGGLPRPDNVFKMDESDSVLHEIDLPEFYIDRLAVTNTRYAEFLDDVSGSAEFDHPDQDPGKDHTPAHWHDRRFNRPDLPVVGIDWYDAWAFARWAGGALPSESQWEKTARGTDERVYPWGNDFLPDQCNYVERAFGRTVSDARELEETLVTANTESIPQEPLLSADSFPEGASPYGAVQMSGNIWELTRTNFFTREDMDPFFRGRRPFEFMHRKDAFHVLRGGAWSSPPPCLATFYRGKDLITDRHNEVGFRCVYPVR
ncbi:SUMF1/EgtB/PvdO family nonheme iron enzyme [Streptomyces malaysiensis]|uniref:SUMF1/EgtB/PvdO family nonheme iron enzyme n=1 Tax=Streptomyces malaysiensis TaxID=92644 RepID=UPI003718F97D